MSIVLVTEADDALFARQDFCVMKTAMQLRTAAQQVPTAI